MSRALMLMPMTRVEFKFAGKNYEGRNLQNL